jgi:MBG domain (YGX type)/Bacterial Ig-like domain (group 3)/Quinohemoprotein amine dehydrogenase, alpha subunit domain III
LDEMFLRGDSDSMGDTHLCARPHLMSDAANEVLRQVVLAIACPMGWRAGDTSHRLDLWIDEVQREDNMKRIVNKSAVLALVLVLIMVVLPYTATPASAADTGFAVPSSYADIDGCDPFNQPQEGRVSDGNCAVETGGDNCSVSYYGFAFSVPSSNIIDGIVITVQANTSPGSDKSLNVSLSCDNGTSWIGTQNTGLITTSDNIFYTVGGAADTWGYASWMPAIINSDYFRVRLDVSGTSGTLKIDSTQAMVYYSMPGTITTVATSGTPSTYDDSVTFTATVSRSGGSDTPSGTVAFRDGGATIGSSMLSGSGGTATATFATSSLAAGSHTITAVYGGSSSFYGSTSSLITQVVNQRNITVAADTQSKVYGDPDPALTYQITSGSLVSGDSFTGALTRAAGELAGTYDIQQGNLALSSNYNLAYVGASLSITARPIIILPPAPILDDIGPESGHAGDTLDIIIDGSDLTGATAVSFGSGVTVNSFVVDSLNRITVNVTIDPDASLGPRDVVVTTPSGDGTLSHAFSITTESTGGSGSWWLWVLGPLLALGLGLLLFFLFFRRRKRETLWDVRARHAYT